MVNHANTYYIEVECNDIFLEYYEILKKDEKFIQKLPLVDDNIKFAKVFMQIPAHPTTHSAKN